MVGIEFYEQSGGKLIRLQQAALKIVHAHLNILPLLKRQTFIEPQKGQAGVSFQRCPRQARLVSVHCMRIFRFLK